MGYQPNLEREEYSPPDKKRVIFAIVVVVIAVLAVALIVYGFFVLARAMVTTPTVAH